MTDVVKPELPNPGDRLADRYTIIQRMSLGGFGAVYRAMQDNLGREIALKVLLPDVVSNNSDYVEQFRQEALLTSQLRHPNTITIFDYRQTDFSSSPGNGSTGSRSPKSSTRKARSATNAVSTSASRSSNP